MELVYIININNYEHDMYCISPYLVKNNNGGDDDKNRNNNWIVKDTCNWYNIV